MCAWEGKSSCAENFYKGDFSDEESPFLLKEFETFAIYDYFLNI